MVSYLSRSSSHGLHMASRFPQRNNFLHRNMHVVVQRQSPFPVYKTSLGVSACAVNNVAKRGIVTEVCAGVALTRLGLETDDITVVGIGGLLVVMGFGDLYYQISKEAESRKQNDVCKKCGQNKG